MESSVIPFVLRNRRSLPPESSGDLETRFDERLQLWMNPVSGLPLVTEYASRNRDESLTASQFGETINAMTREDQPERIRGSDLGETIITRTQEGIDTTERTASIPWANFRLASSKFGETVITATREGVDRSEGSS